MGRSQILGTRIGERRATSASVVATMRAASRIRPLRLHPMPSGAVLVTRSSWCELNQGNSRRKKRVTSLDQPVVLLTHLSCVRTVRVRMVCFCRNTFVVPRRDVHSHHRCGDMN